ncbi:MAG: 2'-5' RNA ligase family protein [Candidatus Pacebacteria bacterium]|nr:2'-5' RNA ligase family protein [Candidatus Paceibacterota bacterium]
MKYSLWFVPTNPTATELQSVIDKLAKQHLSTKFEPHLTLVGNFEIELENLIKVTKEIAKNTQPFKIKLGEVSFSTTYFQAVFVRAKASAELMALNLQFKKALPLPEDVFMPHLSLWYDANLDMAKRFTVANSINLITKEFIADKIIIVPSVPDPKDWKHLTEIQLGS